MRTPKPWILPMQPATRALLAAAGVTDEMIATQLRAGRLVRVRRGVYVCADGWPDDPAGRHLVSAHAVQVANPGAVLSHQSAAVSWKLPTPGFAGWHDALPSLTHPGHTLRRSTATDVELFERALRAADVVHDGDGHG